MPVVEPSCGPCRISYYDVARVEGEVKYVQRACIPYAAHRARSSLVRRRSAGVLPKLVLAVHHGMPHAEHSGRVMVALLG